jgi:predicted O-linked N-acetylglucosamine transferase (SPINDLY family)
LAIRPDYSEVHGNLGLALQAQGRTEEALACYRRIVELQPNSGAAHGDLAEVQKALGEGDEAIATLRRSLDVDPGFHAAHFNLGRMLHEAGQSDAAVTSYRRYLELEPNSVEAHNNLANVLSDLCQFDDAIRTLRRGIDIDSSIADVHYNLGNALCAAGYLHDAVASFRRALEINPRLAGAQLNLGNALHGLGHMHDALASYRRTVELAPEDKVARCNLGVALTDLGYGDAGMASYREALRIDPEYAGAQSNLLFSLNYRPDADPATMREEAGRFGALVARQARPFTAWPNIPDPARRLRVGFVSGDLRHHAVGRFLEGALAALASTAIDRPEIFAYATHFVTDAVTARIRASCSGWHSGVGLSDERLAQRIRDDRIDILIDLSGHSDHNRLPMFAWKPAPVQATWLGYLATTGVAAIDYLIADPWTLPESEEVNFTEKIWRLPESYLCFTARDSSAQSSPLPALLNGHVTFGSFNNLTKVNDEVVALWARVLKRVPDSQLFLKSKQFEGEAVRARMIERFGAHQIDAGRLVLAGFAPMADYLAPFQKVDISLDPFPYPGITTSVESLSMGVPVLTLAGKSFLARQGVGLMMNAGLPEWIADDADDYVARAAALSGDLKAWPRCAVGCGNGCWRRRSSTMRALPIDSQPRCAACGRNGAVRKPGGVLRSDRCREARSLERQRRRQRVSRHKVDRIGDDAVDTPRSQIRDAFRLVRRVAEHAVTGRSHAAHEIGVELLVIDVERDAFEPCEPRGPIGGQLVDEERAGQRGHGVARGLERRLRKRRQQRRRLRVAPQRGGVERHCGARLAFAAGRGLDLDVAEDAVRTRPARDRGERRQRFAGVFRRVPAAGVEPRQFAPRQRVGAPATARRTLERRIVQQERQVVRRELHVELDHPIAMGMANAHRSERVLGRELAGAPVRHEARERPIPDDLFCHRNVTLRRRRRRAQRGLFTMLSRYTHPRTPATCPTQ